MTEFELLDNRFKLQDEFIDLLRAKIEALEIVLKNHVPNFEQQYARELVLAVEHQKKRIEKTRKDLQ